MASSSCDGGFILCTRKAGIDAVGGSCAQIDDGEITGVLRTCDGKKGAELRRVVMGSKGSSRFGASLC